MSNGYKQYQVGDLVRLLRIKRLGELGLSLPQVREVLDVDQVPTEVLRGLDQELARSVERLQQVRHEVAALLAAPTLSAELPAQLSALAGVQLTDADRAFMAVLARVLAPSAVETYVETVLECVGDPAMAAFEDLSPDAGQDERADLARRLAEPLRRHGVGTGYDEVLMADLPPDRQRKATAALTTALRELFHPAQADVLARLSRLLTDTGTSDADPADTRRTPTARSTGTG